MESKKRTIDDLMLATNNDSKRRIVGADYTCYQKVDTDRLQHINELILPPEIEASVRTLYKSVFFTKQEGKTAPKRDPDLLLTRAQTFYCVSDKSGADPEGRIYASGLQNIKGSIRRLLCHEDYHEIDIENSHPCIFAQIVQRSTGSCPDIIKDYAKDKSAVLARVRQEDGFGQATDKQLKKLFIMCLVAPPGQVLDYHGKKSVILTKYKEVVDQLAVVLSQLTPHDTCYAMAREKKSSNPFGRFISMICNRAERKVLLSMAHFFDHKKSTHRIGALIHDSVLVERTNQNLLPVALLGEAQIKIKGETGFEVKLVEKSLKPTDEDWELYHGPKALNKIKSDFLKCCYTLSRKAFEQKLKRMNGFVRQPHATIPGVYVQGMDASEFINRTLSSFQFFRAANMKELLSWFTTKSDHHFELITLSDFKNVISFRNGSFDLESLKFKKFVIDVDGSWKLEDGEPVPITCHYFDTDIDITAVLSEPTPMWDKLIGHQIGPRTVCVECKAPATIKCAAATYCQFHAPDEQREETEATAADSLEWLIGRLFYDVGKYDNWQLFLLLCGDSNSGKSTVLECISAMFPLGSVGCVSANQEGTFGLQPLKSCRVVMFPDLPSNMSKVLIKETWQSMCSGEFVNIPIKRECAITKVWTAPMVAGSNVIPDWRDKSGAVVRRLSVFSWSQNVTDRDGSLKKKIISQELVTVLLRCIVSYRLACERFEDQGFWEKVACSKLKKTKARVTAECNPLAKFLQDGNDYSQCCFEPAIAGKDGLSDQPCSTTTWEELEKCFANHCRYVLKMDKATRIDGDRYPLTQAGYLVETIKLCKICNKDAKEATCRDHWHNGKNRSNRVVIRNMRIKCKKPLPVTS